MSFKEADQFNNDLYACCEALRKMMGYYIKYDYRTYQLLDFTHEYLMTGYGSREAFVRELKREKEKEGEPT